LSFSKKGAISSFTPSSLAGLGLLIFGVAMLLFGRRMDYLFIKTFSLIPVLFGITLYTRGPDITKTLSFPIAYLLLLVPPPMGIVDNITLPMRYWISAIVTVVLKSFHLPAHREGLLIYLGGHEIFMGQPCSGFRSLVTMTALGLVYAYLAKGPFKKKAILIASIVPFALIGNFLRVLALCLITYYLGAAAGQGFFHNFSGIVIFIVMLIGLIILDRSLGGEEYD
ncbi:MAG: exosortase, partial [Candidatus Omnitrophica bacterium]|nr:exosortase [Candidatus Omnitrophota bacterium]